MTNIPVSLTSLIVFWLTYDVANAIQCPDGRQVVCDRICPLIYRPVCGSDLQTYPNSCVLYAVRDCCRAYIFILHGGKCQPFGIPPVLMPFAPTYMVVALVPSFVATAAANTDNQVQQISAPSPGVPSSSPSPGAPSSGPSPAAPSSSPSPAAPSSSPSPAAQSSSPSPAAPSSSPSPAAPSSSPSPAAQSSSPSPAAPSSSPSPAAPSSSPSPAAPSSIPSLGVPVSGGGVSQGSAAAVSGANATAGNNAIQHAWTLTSVNAGVSTQVGQPPKNPFTIPSSSLSRI